MNSCSQQHFFSLNGIEIGKGINSVTRSRNRNRPHIYGSWIKNIISILCCLESELESKSNYIHWNWNRRWWNCSITGMVLSNITWSYPSSWWNAFASNRFPSTDSREMLESLIIFGVKAVISRQFSSRRRTLSLGHSAISSDILEIYNPIANLLLHSKQIPYNYFSWRLHVCSITFCIELWYL